MSPAIEFPDQGAEARAPVVDYATEIQRIIEGEIGFYPSSIQTVLAYVIDLYRGAEPSFEPCRVGYHTIHHALEVTLATCRMLAGWNHAPSPGPRISEPYVRTAVAAALLHDAGYLKDRGDNEGKGGKYTFSHVARSVAMARNYLQRNHWPDELQQLTAALIEATEFNQEVRLEGVLAAPPEKTIASMLVTADILAQVSDHDYFDRLPELFAEFEEGYAFEGRDRLAARGIHIFQSLEELRDGSQSFFREVVLPRMETLGRMDLYLDHYFGEKANPYREGILRNFGHRL